MHAAILVVLLGLTSFSGLEFHVANDGADTNPGTADAPFATLQGARNAMRAAKESAELPEGDATIWVHPGDFSLNETLALGAEDSGTENKRIVYRAVEPASVRILGGRSLPADAFARVDSEEILALLPDEARGNVLYVDMKAMGVVDYGSLPDSFEQAVPLPELFFNDQRMTLACWPNEGWAEIDSVVESGPAPWRNHASEALGVFAYTGDRPGRWLSAKSLLLEGYWCFDWSCEAIRVEAIDPEKRHITLAKQHVYGIGSGNPAPRRYRAINLLEELDTPGEYFLDRDAGLLYFWPPAPLDGARVVLSLLAQPLLQFEDCAHVTIQGLTFETTSGAALRIDGGSRITLAGCTIRNTGQEGAVINGGEGHLVQSCDIHDTGTGGLHIGGGDRKTLTPSGHAAVNNHIYRVSRRMRTHAYNLHVNGVGVRLAHNRIGEAPHQAIGLGGNDHLLEYNEVHHAGMESDDCGAFYMGRNPSDRGTVLRYNFWHHLGSTMAHGSCAIYFDDGAGGQTVHGNVFYKASGGSFGAVFNHGGHDNVVSNNLFVQCSRAVGAAPWNDATWKEWIEGDLWQERLLEEVDITQPPYSDRYPELEGFMTPDGRLRMNRADRNIAVQCGSLANGNWTLEDSVTLNSDPGFVDAEKLNFALREDAEIFKLVPEFEPIPFDRIGLYLDEFRTKFPE